MPLNRQEIENADTPFEGEGAKGLWQAVVVQAVKDATYPVLKFENIIKITDYFQKNKQIKHFINCKTAIEWILSKDENYGSFRWIGQEIEPYTSDEVDISQNAMSLDPLIVENIKIIEAGKDLQDAFMLHAGANNIHNMLSNALKDADCKREVDEIIEVSSSYNITEVAENSIKSIAYAACRSFAQADLF